MAQAARRWRWEASALLAAGFAAAALLVLLLARTPAPELPFAGQGGQVRAERAYGGLPLAFEPNAGRAGRGVDYVSRSASGTVLLRPDGATLALGRGKRSEAIGLELAGAATTRPQALERLPGVVNDLRGDDPKRWRTEIPTFERVRYPGVWPGIDVDYYGNQRRLEYDLRLAPGADPDRIAVRVAGADRLRMAPNGDLLIGAGDAAVRQRAPVAYQPPGHAGDSRRTPVRADFALSGDTVSFRLGPYDHDRPLVIDPLVLPFSTYLGGASFDQGLGIIYAPGAVYVTGGTSSSDFPTVSGVEGDSGGTDVFVSKFTSDGSALEYSTYLGGNAFDEGRGIGLAGGAPVVTGRTDSTDFETVGAIEADSAGRDAFVSKLTPDGSDIEYSTYLGGAGLDEGLGIAVDHTGAAYVTGRTDSTDFDTVGAIEGDSAGRDAFVSKLTSDGGALEYSTYLGGDGVDESQGIDVEFGGAAYITGLTDSTDFNTVGEIEGDSAGRDAFVSKLIPEGSALEYSTYLGGNGIDEGYAIEADRGTDEFEGGAYVTGGTDSTDFNTVGEIESNVAGRDAFVSKLIPEGSALEYSTYLGGTGTDEGRGIAVIGRRGPYVTGFTASTDFPTVGDARGFGADSGGRDAFVSKFTPDGDKLDYSAYLGGDGVDEGYGIATDAAGGTYVTGETGSSDFATAGAVDNDESGRDAFVSKLKEGCTRNGTSGNDMLFGGAGDDVICGHRGDDVILGRGGNDVLLGENDDDVLIGSFGGDTLDGGPGQDRASFFADATGGVDVNFKTGVVTSANLGMDRILLVDGASTIEQAGGTQFADTLIGDEQDNVLEGSDGDDMIEGGDGADSLFGRGGADTLLGRKGADRLEPADGNDPVVSGEAGSDTLRYANATGAVAVDLAAGTASALDGGDSGTDTLATDIENIVGSAGDDELIATLAGIASLVQGGNGADSLDTADGDSLDTAAGGADADTCTTDGGDTRSSCP
jgi:Ca2+-binding RTX toxin-like protein